MGANQMPCGGMTPVWRDEAGKCVVYATKAEAEAVILEDFLEKQRQFFKGERAFQDAMTIEDIICKVTQLPDGSVVDAWGGNSHRKYG